MRLKWHLAIIFIFVFCAVGLSAPLRQSTATTITIGPLVDWANGKSILRDNGDFDPNDLACEIIKGSSSSTLTLTKTGGSNNINLTGYGQATLTLTADDTNTPGSLKISLVNKMTGGFSTETILPVVEYYTIYPANVYDSLFLGTDKLQVDTVQIEGVDATDNINAEVNKSIETYNLDHLLLTGDASLANILNDQTVFAWLLSIGGDVSNFNDVTDSQEALREKVDTIPTKPSRPSF